MNAGPERDFEAARRVADAVLFEGYLLYPYRSSAQKNRLRWQFGVLAPREWSRRTGSEPWRTRTETLLEAEATATVHVRLRCLHLQTRPDQAPGGWDEGAVKEVDAGFALERLLDGAVASERFVFAGDGGGTLTCEEVRGRIRVRACRIPGPYGAVRLRVDTENTTPWAGSGARRDEALRRSLVAAHLLLGVEGGRFISLADPPEWARSAAGACRNEGTWPVLLGGHPEPTVVLSSPIILPDGARVADESPGDLFDATEIDEILSLRVLALTDEEKDLARRTDPRAAALVDRLEDMPAETWTRLHGAVRSLHPVTSPAPVPPWWDPGTDASVCPDTDCVVVAGVALSKGSRVRLRPGRADAQDMFLIGREAVVQAVLSDVDGGQHLAVSVAEDPAADLLQAHGRYLYFHPEEVEPL